MKTSECEKCEHSKRICAQGEWWFRACYCEPYRGKWIQEIESCPKEQLKEKKDES